MFNDHISLLSIILANTQKRLANSFITQNQKAHIILSVTTFKCLYFQQWYGAISIVNPADRNSSAGYICHYFNFPYKSIG